ncbi:MAG TPA: 50S ribosomal protein L13 [Candidatus Paceibacterota bacterium]|nr:50S ribosomal protein L13 [Candidatus Paceibacterota bacterium]
MLTVDAQNKKLGRLASEVAILLMGKDMVDFARNKIPDRDVKVVNVSKLDIDERKKEQKEYVRYSGYPGGLKKEKLGALMERKGSAEVLRKAVRGMLPGNKLRPLMLKHLIIEE